MSLIVEIILVRQKRFPENTHEKEEANLTAIFSYFHTNVKRHCLVRHVVDKLKKQTKHKYCYRVSTYIYKVKP